MELMEFTNLIIKKGIKKGLDIDFYLDIDNESYDEPCPQIEISIRNEHYEAFALFYALADDNINFSSIFETSEIDQEKFEAVFNEDMGIFQSILFDEDNNCIHLYSQIDKEALTEEYVDEIIEFLQNKNPIKIINYLQ